MAENVNTQSVFTNKTFITLETLTYFWGKTKEYINPISSDVTTLKSDVTALKDNVGDATKGLVKEVSDIRLELEGINEGAGSISTQINNALAALDVTDEAVAGEYVSSVAEVDGKVVVTRAALPDYSNTFDANGAAADALDAAKTYANSLVTVDGVAKFDAAGAAAEVDGKLTTHVADAVVHITTNERAEWNAAKTAIDAFLKDADMTESAVDTLKELQTYMTTDGDAATALVNRVKALEDDKDAYAGADETVLTNAKAYADGLVKNEDGTAKFDVAGAAATAKSEAIVDAVGKYQPIGNYEAAGAAAQALADAKADAENLYQPKGEYEAAGTADTKIAALDLPNSYDAKGSAEAAKSAAIAQAKIDAAAALLDYYKKTETYSQTEINNLLTTNSTADQAYAKQYTDELFNSFVFAQNSDIDKLFATTNA